MDNPVEKLDRVVQYKETLISAVEILEKYNRYKKSDEITFVIIGLQDVIAILEATGARMDKSVSLLTKLIQYLMFFRRNS